jgi:hypothetical protein
METESVVINIKNGQVIIYGKKGDFARRMKRTRPFC